MYCQGERGSFAVTNAESDVDGHLYSLFDRFNLYPEKVPKLIGSPLHAGHWVRHEQ